MQIVGFLSFTTATVTLTISLFQKNEKLAKAMHILSAPGFTHYALNQGLHLTSVDQIIRSEDRFAGAPIHVIAPPVELPIGADE